MVAILVLLTVIMFMTVDYLVQRAQARKAAIAAGFVVTQPAFAAASTRKPVRVPFSAAPKGVFFDRNHQWLEMESTGTVKIGMDHFPGAVLGSAFNVDLPVAGTKVKKGQPVVTLKKGDRTLAMPAPIDGEIEEVNLDLSADPDALKRSPYGEGWIYKIRPASINHETFAAKMIGDEAVDWMKTEMRRLRDFIGSIPHSPGLAWATLQDGGEPVEGFADGLSDDQWNRLKSEFFA